MTLSGKEWDLGRAGESRARQRLMAAGFFVMPACDIENGKAPALERVGERLILPDFLACGIDANRWIEVKTKGTASFHYQYQRHEHGLATSSWCWYRKVQAVTKIPVWLAILEGTTGELLLKDIDNLELVSRYYWGRAMPDGRPHVYFPRDAFDRLDDIDGGDYEELPLIPPAASRTLAQPPVQRRFA